LIFLVFGFSCQREGRQFVNDLIREGEAAGRENAGGDGRRPPKSDVNAPNETVTLGTSGLRKCAYCPILDGRGRLRVAFDDSSSKLPELTDQCHA